MNILSHAYSMNQNKCLNADSRNSHIKKLTIYKSKIHDKVRWGKRNILYLESRVLVLGRTDKFL